MSKLHKDQNGFSVFEGLLVILIIGLIALVGWYVYKRMPGSTASVKPSKILTSAKPQFPSSQTLAGYLTYNPEKFQPAPTLKFPHVGSVYSDTNVIIAQGTLLSTNESGLYLYDLRSNIAYKLTSGGGDPRIMSDHYLIYGFDEGSGSKHQLGAKLLDLQTGKTNVVYSDSPANAPGTACCSVSPDGFKAAIVHKDKLSVWDIRTDTLKDYPVTLNPIGSGFYTGSEAPYNVEISYAKPVWADNTTILFADKPAVTHTADSNPIVDTNIFSLDTATGKVTELPTPNSGIYEIWLAHGQPYVLDVSGSEEHVTKIGPSAADQPQVVFSGTIDDTMELATSGKRVIISGLTIDQKHIFQAYDIGGGNLTDLSYVPANANASNTNVTSRGWLDEDHMVAEIQDTSYPNSHSYLGIINILTGKLEEYSEIH